jgi:ABC-type glycerol-3-phosphate transport system permease component
MHRPSPWRLLLTYLALIATALFVLVPVWGIIYPAFDGSIKGHPSRFRVWPEQFTLDVFRETWEHPAQTLSFLGVLRNSLVVAGGAALSSVALGASMAYGFARFRFPGRRVGLFGLLVGTLLPPVALMTPLYILLTAFGLRTTLMGLGIVYASFSMPFCIWNMRSAFQAVPRELESAALLDGASDWMAFWRVTLPLAMPSIGVAALLAFLMGYSEFAIGWLFVETSETVTLAMAISGLLRSGYYSWSKLAALSILMALPVVALFLILQRSLLRGLLVGSTEN